MNYNTNDFHPLDGQKVVPGRGIWTTDNEAFGDCFSAHSRTPVVWAAPRARHHSPRAWRRLSPPANPGLTAAEVKEVLQPAADKIVDPDRHIVLVTNRSQYDRKGRCRWFGFGKLNAEGGDPGRAAAPG